MQITHVFRFKNSLQIENGFMVPLYDRISLLTTPLHQCASMLNGLADSGDEVYAGSHHMAVIKDGRRVLFLKEDGY